MNKKFPSVISDKLLTTERKKCGIKEYSFPMLLGFLLVFCLCDCKKSCVTCGSGFQGPDRYDSSTVIHYDTVLHQYDTLLIRVDLIIGYSSQSIVHYCPGSQEYNAITSSGILYNGGMPCTYDQH